MNSLAFIQNLGFPELIVIFMIALLLFGAKRMPELFRSFGHSIKEFKKATSNIEDDIRTAMDSDDNSTKSKRAPEGATPAPQNAAPEAPKASEAAEKRAESTHSTHSTHS